MLQQEHHEPLWERISDLWERFAALPEVKTALQIGQLAASLLFVVLYVWSTYKAPPPLSWRFNLDLLLCATFALDYLLRFLVCDPELLRQVARYPVFNPFLEQPSRYSANVGKRRTISTYFTKLNASSHDAFLFGLRVTLLLHQPCFVHPATVLVQHPGTTDFLHMCSFDIRASAKNHYKF